MKINYWQEYKHDSFYHIYNHSGNEKKIFFTEDDYLFFLKNYFKYFNVCFDTISYCLMPNHFHFLVKVKSENDIIFDPKQIDSIAIKKFVNKEVSIASLLEDQYRRFFSSYSLWYNNKYKIRGQLFLNRHKRVEIDLLKRFEYILCYIHHNPIHHFFVKEYSEWSYSSYNTYFSSLPSEVNREIALNIIGNMDEFIKIHDKFKLEKMEELNLD